ncbi:hypothetical protein [Absidia glauca]|uniref:C2H2-type domain-containing protein n=1 Tax=Absidia glauca TaxID=4829 RepID=A0A163MUI4_ABSGL|nr:hypothetical protein [Absidia glauca]
MLSDDRQAKDSFLSVIDASGRQISLLNDNGGGLDPGSPQSYSSDEPTTTAWKSPEAAYNSTAPSNLIDTPSLSANSKRKYYCSEPGCNKAFTTSGHLARHHRVHTGEKNFPCLFPGCQSRFSRQDNMMQHYRTHMSPKSRRTTTKRSSEETTTHPRPKLHAHHRIRSDPYQVDPPLTIDQHLNNYHRSLVSAPSPSKHQSLRQQTSYIPSNAFPLSSSALTSSSLQPASTSIPPSTPSRPHFYQHRPLVYPSNHHSSSHSHSSSRSSSSRSDSSSNSSCSNSSESTGAGHPSFTLLHPPPATTTNPSDAADPTPESSKPEKKDPKQDSLLQLAHIVSTFG